MPASLENSAVAWKRSVSFLSQRRAMPKNVQTTAPTVLISRASKVILKIHQDGLQQYVNQELPDVQAGFRKGRGTRGQIVNIHWIIEKENSRKTSTSVSLTMLKPLIVWITTNWKILKEIGTPDVLPAS